MALGKRTRQPGRAFQVLWVHRPIPIVRPRRLSIPACDRLAAIYILCYRLHL